MFFIPFCEVGGITVILATPIRITDYLDYGTSTNFFNYIIIVIAQIEQQNLMEETKFVLIDVGGASFTPVQTRIHGSNQDWKLGYLKGHSA